MGSQCFCLFKVVYCTTELLLTDRQMKKTYLYRFETECSTEESMSVRWVQLYDFREICDCSLVTINHLQSFGPFVEVVYL